MPVNAPRAARTNAPAAKAKVLPPARTFAKQRRVTGPTLARLGGKHLPVERQRFSLPREFRHSSAQNYSPAVSSLASPSENAVRGDSLISGAGLLEALSDLPQREAARHRHQIGIDLHPWSFPDRSAPAARDSNQLSDNTPAPIIQFAQLPTTHVIAPPVRPLHRLLGKAITTPSLQKIDAASITTTGAPLPVAVRNPLARTFSVDLTPIRVHTDAGAQRVVRSLSTRAFAYGHNIFLGPGEQPTDLGLIAHEVAHVIQQSHGPTLQHFTPGSADSFEHEAERASAAAVHGESFTVRQRTQPRPQGLFGISLPNPLTWLANRANNIPGFRMLTIILGRNPVNGQEVPRSAANIFRAIVGFIPGGELIIQALDNYGIFDRVGNWVEQQINSLGMTAGLIRSAVTDFISSLSASDILHLGRVWDRAVRIFTTPIDRLISFGRGLATGIIRIIKDAILRPLARLAQGTRGWDLLTAVLRQNPITGEPVQRNAETLIGGFMRLISQEEVWQNIQRARAIPRAWAWFQGALEGLMAFVRDIPSRFVAELRQLEIIDIVILPRAFMRIGRVFASFVGSFVSWAGNQVLSLLQIIFEVVAPRVMPYLRRTAGALATIFRNPGGFAHNLVRAGAQGFRQFKDNFLNHLRRSLIEWLTGAMSGSGIYIPQAINLREIIKFVLSVLGLTWQNLRAKLVRAIGATAVSVLETTFDIVVTLVREGPAAAWERISQSISNLREMVMGQIMTFVRERIVVAAITTLVSSMVPGAGFIRAIISIYDTITFFVQRARQIAETVGAFIDSMAAIASGNIGTAANRVETTMARTLTIIISFLASVLRLGRVTDAITGVVNQLRQPIDRALDRVAEWIRERAQSLLQRAAGGNPQQRLERALAAGQSVVNRFAGRRVGALVLRPLLAVIRMRFQLQTLEAVPRGSLWVVRGVVNPAGERPTGAQVGGAAANFGEGVRFNAAGESHRLWIAVSGRGATLMVATAERRVQNLLEWMEGRFNALPEGRRADTRRLLDQAWAKFRGTDSKANRVVAASGAASAAPVASDPTQSEIVADENTLASLLQRLLDSFGAPSDLGMTPGNPRELIDQTQWESVAARIEREPEVRLSERSAGYNERVLTRFIDLSTVADKARIQRRVEARLQAARDATDGHEIYVQLRNAARIVNGLTYPPGVPPPTLTIHHEERVWRHPATFSRTRAGRLYASIQRRIANQAPNLTPEESAIMAITDPVQRRGVIQLWVQQRLEQEIEQGSQQLDEVEMEALTARAHDQIHRGSRARRFARQHTVRLELEIRNAD
ncbi:MAG TPA: DUF4157 domain-containing protein [Pyrinomonadaceae bacterium]|nr:DUF4157 domain-containing protein [Pyrinomonadaceae bacterium]